ncbi:cell division protein ZapB [Desulfatitalea tepidiphila]|uniref:cell division protein ZapB n=1 Tax=Desulfatitalea tepidiphila TaxID=1185843 RepID=UPI0006B50B4E|nr:cell division protein ZapB [Desulfatitalea tepidiphila]
MEHEIVLQKFELLENKVERLIEVIHQLKNENEALKQEKETLAYQLVEKTDAEKHNDELKSLVKTKIDNMIGRLAEFVED